MLEQITAGLEHAHCQGLMHGALSLSYLLVPQGQQIQIAGRGWQQLLERRDILPVAAPREHVLTLAGTRLVAQRYLAPECLHEGQPADIRSDAYSLGVILGELLTGRSPFRGTSFLIPLPFPGSCRTHQPLWKYPHFSLALSRGNNTTNDSWHAPACGRVKGVCILTGLVR